MLMVDKNYHKLSQLS